MTTVLVIYLAIIGIGCALVTLANRLGLPYPLLLVVAGIILGFIPGLPRVNLNPDIVLLGFLPPLVYAAGTSSSFRDFWAEIRAISLLSVGLVLFSTLFTAVLTHYLIPGFSWPLAFVLGAAISPPDEVAAIAVLRRLGIPQRLQTILEGEGLVNDASALVAYRFALAAVLTGAFSMRNAVLTFAGVVISEVLWGLFVGWAFSEWRRRIHNSAVETLLSLLTPYVAYLPAQHLGGSGVLAIVATAFYIGSRGMQLFSPVLRVRAQNVWSTVDLLLNSLLFLLTGLQLRGILESLHAFSYGQLAKYGLLVSGAVILLRFIWVFPLTYLPRLLIPSLREREPAPPWQFPFLISWTGIRGSISLAAALALPITLRPNTLFPQRDLIIFLCFSVIFATLVGLGLFLPMLIRVLGLGERREQEELELTHRELKARIAATKAALALLKKKSAQECPTRLRQYLEEQYRSRQHFLNELADSPDSKLDPKISLSLHREILQTERATLLDLRQREQIDDEVFRRVEEDLDLEDVKYGTEELDGDE